jgi:hypothetical protein
MSFEKKEKEIEEKFAEQPSIIKIEGVEGAREVKENKEEKEAREEIAKELEKVKLSPQIKTQTQKQADDIKDESEQGKVERLLEIAETQGLVYAVEVAKKMDSPLLLDKFHDVLAQNKLFKKYLDK